MKFSKAIVSLVILLNAAFTVAVLYIFYRVGTGPTALIAAGELWFLAGIRKKKMESDIHE